jgi:hypothetical protein
LEVMNAFPFYSSGKCFIENVPQKWTFYQYL